MRSASCKRARWKSLFSLVSPNINADGIHKWDFGPGLQVDVARLNYRMEHPMPMNQHDYFELIFLVSGELTWQVQDRFFSQQKGDLCLITNWLYHRILEFSSPPVKLIQLSFLPEVVRSDCAHGDDTEYLMPFLQQDDKCEHVLAAKTGIPAEVAYLVYKIERRLPATSHLDQMFVRSCLKMMLVLLAEYYSKHPSSAKAAEDRRRATERLRPVFELLGQRYAEPIHVADAARVVGMSRSRFERFFKQIVGQPFVCYLNHFRVAHAQELLRSPGQSLAEVSQHVGFCDQSYFGRVFQRFTHLTPKQYRQKYTRSARKRVASPINVQNLPLLSPNPAKTRLF